MKPNVGGLDRGIRIIAGLAMLAAGFYYKSWWGLVGLVPLATGILRWCPAYLPFGISSCAPRDSRQG
jgi:type IV secretory pathway TrbD component